MMKKFMMIVSAMILLPFLSYAQDNQAPQTMRIFTDGSNDMSIQQQLGQTNVTHNYLIAPSQVLSDVQTPTEQPQQVLAEKLAKIKQAIQNKADPELADRMDNITELMLLLAQQNQLLITQNQQVIEVIQAQSKATKPMQKKEQ